MSKEPHQQNIRRNDPVTQFQKYQNSWKQHRAPGDKAHSALRWNVREHMLYQDQVVKKVLSLVHPLLTSQHLHFSTIYLHFPSTEADQSLCA